MAKSFELPFFYNYPPYFTLQPIKETRDKQLSLWCQLILQYCKHNKVYLVSTTEDFPLFKNDAINRTLNLEFRSAILDELTAQGSGEWLDKNKRQCLIFWRKLADWVDIIYEFAQTYGLKDSVMTVDELATGDDVRGTELQGIHRELLMRALRALEEKGKVRLFKGATPDEEGVKFL